MFIMTLVWNLILRSNSIRFGMLFFFALLQGHIYCAFLHLNMKWLVCTICLNNKKKDKRDITGEPGLKASRYSNQKNMINNT